MDLASQVHQALARMEDALEKNENRTVFSLFVGRRIEGDINGKLFFQPFSH